MKAIRREITAALTPLGVSAMVADVIADRTMQRFWRHRTGDLDVARHIPPWQPPAEDLQAPDGYADVAMTVCLALGRMERALRLASWVELTWPMAYAAEAVAEALSARNTS